MAEYIEREAVLEILKRHSVGTWRGIPCYPDEIKSAAKDVNSIPAADVATVVHGRWIGIEYDGYADGCPVYDLWECSECGEELGGDDVPDMNPYCRNCGARMDGG